MNINLMLLILIFQKVIFFKSCYCARMRARERILKGYKPVYNVFYLCVKLCKFFVFYERLQV